MEKILRMLKNEPYKIGHFAGLTDLTELNNAWIKNFLYRTDDQTLLAHRGSYKTSSLAVFLAIHTITKPNENIILFRKTDNDVAEVIRLVRNILNSGATREIVRRIYGKDLQLLTNRVNEIDTNLRSSNLGALQIQGLGVNASLTGKHANIVITDDIVNVKDRVSRAEREHTKLVYQELQNIKNRGGRFINTGTPWHKDDAFLLMPNQTKFDCYATRLIAKDELKALRESMSDSLFAANYELKHISDKEALFQNPQFTDDESLIYGGVAHLDAAYGGSDGTAYTIFKRDGDVIYGFGKRWDRHVDDCISELKVLHNQYQAGSLSCERNADKGYLARALQAEGFIVETYNENENKFIKISTHLRKNWKKIVWLDDTDLDYLNEILDYTENAEHDDAPDSAASLLRRMETRVEYHAVSGGL